MSSALIQNRKGAALFMTLVVSIAIAGIALGGVLLASGAQLSTKYNAKEAQLQASADGGLEVIRDSLNRGIFDTLLPLAGYTTLGSGLAVRDAYGNTLPRITQSIYVGRTGGRTGGAATAGQYGSNFASGLSVISDARGAVAVRRMLMTQESWAKFAVAINNWSGSAAYGCGESVNGPFFSNSGLIIQGGCSSPKTLFAGPASVVGSVTNASSGNFTQGLKTGVTPITWPTPARIALMRQYAQDADAVNGDYDLTSLTNGSKIPGLRIEFVTIDVNGNGVIDWDEGFMRVWVPANTSDTVLAYATGRRWPRSPAGVALNNAVTNTDPNAISRNCGAVRKVVTADGPDSLYFHTAQQMYARTGGSAAVQLDSSRSLLVDNSHRCYLGGDPRLYHLTTGDTLTPTPTVTNSATNAMGSWMQRHSGAWPSLSTVRSGDKAYLIPLGSNPNFKGVIYVQGDVAISGRLRGRVSVFATGNIIMADDLLYQNPPGTKCDAQGDIFGAIATKDVIIEDNNLQTPFEIGPPSGVGIAKVYGGFDDSNDANYNMFFLAAGDATGTTGNWYGEGADPADAGGTYPQWLKWGTGSGSGAASFDSTAIRHRCGDPTTGASNGCVRVTGGLGEGRVDNWTYYTSDFGWAEAHTYDPCGSVNPPPYFPTTGRFIPSRYYEIDPVWLNSIGIGSYFTRLQSQ